MGTLLDQDWRAAREELRYNMRRTRSA